MKRYIISNDKPVITDKMTKILLYHRFTLATMKRKLKEFKNCPVAPEQ